MKTLVGFAVLASLTGAAGAQPYEYPPQPRREPIDGYFAVGGVLGAHRAMHLGGAVEAGLRAGDSPVFVHAMFAAGDSGLVTEGGSFWQARGGLEARSCILREVLCGFAGADVGYQYEHAVTHEWVIDGDIMSTEAHDLLVVPRVGYEIGHHVKFRGSIEMPLATRLDEHERGFAVAGMFGVGFAF